MLYRTTTFEYRDYLIQQWYDSKTQLYSIWLYDLDGRKIKHCKPSDTEKGAVENAFAFLDEYEKSKEKA